jgi:hypothetical protein
MSHNDFEQFRQIVLDELPLQEELRVITERNAFYARVVELGAERGFRFSDMDVREAMEANHRMWVERWI